MKYDLSDPTLVDLTSNFLHEFFFRFRGGGGGDEEKKALKMTIFQGFFLLLFFNISRTNSKTGKKPTVYIKSSNIS